MRPRKRGARISEKIKFIDYAIFISLVIVAVPFFQHMTNLYNSFSEKRTYTRDLSLFDSLIEVAGEHFEQGDIESAKNTYYRALQSDSLLMKDATDIFVGLAKLAIVEEDYVSGKILAQLIANLRPGDPDIVNTYAEILIRTCQTELAIHALNALLEKRDAESEELLGLASVKSNSC